MFTAALCPCPDSWTPLWTVLYVGIPVLLAIVTAVIQVRRRRGQASTARTPDRAAADLDATPGAR
jgi:predicted signal transduction protein with EAL and GGDEF domain